MIRVVRVLCVAVLVAALGLNPTNHSTFSAPVRSSASPSTALDCSGSYAITGTVPLQLSQGAPSTETDINGQLQLQESNGQFADNITFNSPLGASGSLWGMIDASGTVTATFQIGNAQGSLVVSTNGTASADCSLIQLQGMSGGQPVNLTLVPSSSLPSPTPTTPTGPPTYNCTGSYSVAGAPLNLAGSAQLNDTDGNVTGNMTLNAPVATSGLVTATIDANGVVSGTISLNFPGFMNLPVTGQAAPNCVTAALTSTLNLLGHVITETVTLTQLSTPSPTATPTGTPPTSTPTDTPGAPTDTATPTMTPTDTVTPTDTSAPTDTPTSTDTPTGTLQPTDTPTSTNTPVPSGPCSGLYDVAGAPVKITGTTLLSDDLFGNISGPLTITAPIPATGTVSGTVDPNGVVTGIIAVPALAGLGLGSLPVNGQATPTCSSAVLSATVFGVSEAFTLTQQAPPATATPTSTPTSASTPSDTPTGTVPPSDTPTNTATPTNTPPPTDTPTDTPIPPTNTPVDTVVPTSNACSGTYTIVGTPAQISGQAQLTDDNGSVNGSLSLALPGTSTTIPGQVSGSVDGSGNINGTIGLTFNGANVSIPATGHVTSSDCSGATLSATLTNLGGIVESFTLTRIAGGPAPTNTPVGGTPQPTNTPTNTATPTNTPTSTNTVIPSNTLCVGTYSVTAAPVAIDGQAVLQDSGGTISGSLGVNSPIPANGTVSGVVGANGSVNGTLSLPTLASVGLGSVSVTGNATADCSSATLTANVFGVAETFTLQRTSQSTAPLPTVPPATPTDTPTNTPVANTATNTPTPQQGSLQAPTRTAGLAQCQASNSKPALALGSTPRNVTGGERLAVGLRTAAHALVTLQVQVKGQKVSYTGKGKHRKRVVHSVVLYQKVFQSTANAHGQAVAGGMIAYKPAKSTAAGLTITARNACGLATRTGRVTITPQVFSIKAQAAPQVRVSAAQPGCASTVALKVTVTFVPRTPWTRNAVLVYQPGRGIRVLASKAHLDRHGALYVAVPRPRDGHSTVVIRLAMKTAPALVRDRKGHRHEVAAAVGGAVSVLRGHATLGKVALHVSVSSACKVAKPVKHTGKPGHATATPTPPAGALGAPTATPGSGAAAFANCSGTFTLAGKPLKLQGTAQLVDNKGKITGNLDVQFPVPAKGTVVGTVTPDGTVNGTLSFPTLASLGMGTIVVSGTAAAGCGSATLHGVIFKAQETFMLARG